MSFDDVMETGSMRAAAKRFASASSVKDVKALIYTEQVFMAGAAWAWKRMADDISAKRKQAQQLIKDWK